METPELLTERLKLRGWRDDDLEALAEIKSHPENARYAVDGALPDFEATADLLDEFVSEWEEQEFGRWAVEELATGLLIGDCGFLPYDAHTGELTFAIAPPRWGNRLATEAARAVLRYGFEHLHFNRVIATTSMGNRPAQRVLEKIGMHKVEDRPGRGGARMLVYGLTDLERRQRYPAPRSGPPSHRG